MVLAVVALAGCDSVPPSVPAPTTAAATSCTAVAVGWAVSVDEPGGSGLARYRIYRDAALLTEVAATATSWADTVSGPVSHVYGVAAVDVAGNESAAQTASVMVPSCINDTKPPSKPKNLTVSAPSCTQVALAWGASGDQGGSGLAGYDVYRGGAWLLHTSDRTATDASVTQGGAYTYTVRAVDGAGNQSTASDPKSVTVPTCGGSEPPVADAGPNHATQTLTAISFDGSDSSDTDGSIVDWTWDFGDGTTGNGMAASHAFGHAGSYVVRLTVVDDDGLESSDTTTVTASNRAPVANAGPDRSAAVGSAVAFSGSASTDSDGQITSYAWNFGDGGTANGVAPSHAFSQAGTYSVRLTVTDDMGASHSDTAQVTVGEAGELVWTRTFGGPTFVDGVTVNDIATAPDGSVVVTGVLTGTANFGSGNLTSGGGNDVFVAAWSADGQPRWARRYGATSGHDFGASVTVADDGDVIVTGGFTGTIDFGGGPLTTAGSYDIFVLRLASSGAHRWSRRGGGTGDDSGAAVAVDLAGDVTFAGTISGSAEVGGATLTSAGGRDIVLAHYAGATGAHLWSKRFGANGFDAPEDLVADADGSVVMTGVFAGSVNFGGGNLSASGSDVVLARYAASGAHLWSRDFGASGDDQVSGLALAPDGDLVLAGQFASTIDFGGGSLTNSGAADVYVARLGSQGTHVWSRRWGTGSAFALVTTGVSVDPDGAVVFAGGAIEAISFGGLMLPISGGYDPYLVKLDAAGAHVWSKRCGSSGYPYNYSAGVATDGDGNVFATGSFSGGIDLGAGLLQNANNLVNQSYDGFIAKRRP